MDPGRLRISDNRTSKGYELITTAFILVKIRGGTVDVIFYLKSVGVTRGFFSNTNENTFGHPANPKKMFAIEKNLVTILFRLVTRM